MVPYRQGKPIAELARELELLGEGVIVRPVPGCPRHLRVTIGLAEENDRLLETLARQL